MAATASTGRMRDAHLRFNTNRRDLLTSTAAAAAAALPVGTALAAPLPAPAADPAAVAVSSRFAAAAERERLAYRYWMDLPEEHEHDAVEKAAVEAWERARAATAATPVETRADAAAAVAWLTAEVRDDQESYPVDETLEVRLLVLASLAAFLAEGRA